MHSERKNFYTVSDIHKIIFLGSLSRTTIHNLIRKGKIPSVAFMSKRLIPAWWVENALKEANQAPKESMPKMEAIVK